MLIRQIFRGGFLLCSFRKQGDVSVIFHDLDRHELLQLTLSSLENLEMFISKEILNSLLLDYMSGNIKKEL